MMRNSFGQAALASWSARDTPLGRLCLGGVFPRSQGTGFTRFRFFAQYALVFVYEGEARYRDQSGRDLTLRPGDVIAVLPDLGHQYGPRPGRRWSEAFITFSGAAFDRWVRPDALTPDRPTWFLGPPEIWLPRWREIIDRRSETERDALELAAQMHLLLHDVIAQAAPPIAPADIESRVRRSVSALEAWPPGRPVDWAELARQSHCAVETWRKVFVRLTGVSPARYRRRVLMETAAGLLARGRHTNEELAERFGCSDAFHFSRMFKAVHGVHPREFRQSRGRWQR